MWLVTVEMPGQPVQGWIEKNHFKAVESIDNIRKASDFDEKTTFGLFRLSLVGGKIYANRITFETNNKSPDARESTPDPKLGNGEGGVPESGYICRGILPRSGV